MVVFGKISVLCLAEPTHRTMKRHGTIFPSEKMDVVLDVRVEQYQWLMVSQICLVLQISS